MAGAFTALCDLREVTPYAFGYMMAAKVGTGFVAELGSMRISDEIDALEVLGLDSLVYLCATRLLGMWMVLPFVYIAAISFGFAGSYIAVVRQIGEVSPGGYLEIFWQFQNPVDLIYSAIKGMSMATFIVIVGCYYGYNAGGGPVGRGQGHRAVDGGQHPRHPRDRDARHPAVLGRQPAGADRRMTPRSSPSARSSPPRSPWSSCCRAARATRSTRASSTPASWSRAASVEVGGRVGRHRSRRSSSPTTGWPT